MGFLSPLLLAAAAAVGVPLLLHLFQRQEGRRVAFPALRYLLRTERDHARRIRARQLLLLLVRSAIVLLLALAAARPFLRGGGGAHPPTALAVVLDNSMSSGRIVDGVRVLDRLKEAAGAAIRQAGDEDRIWILRAGEPWEIATPGTAAEALDRVAATEVSAARGDLSDAVRRAAGLVREAGLAAAEVHVLSDLQATGLGDGNADLPHPVLVFRGGEERPAPNRYLGNVQVGGGLAPLTGRRTELAVGLAGDTTEAPVRLLVDGQLRGAAHVEGGATTTFPFGPFPEGWVSGSVETDPDALAEDDHRWFAVRVRPPPVVTLRGGGEEAFFLREGLAVLADAGRLRDGGGDAEVVVAVGGEGAGLVSSGRTVVVVPPSDPTLLPALNRRLAEAGIPWRYEVGDGEGGARIADHRLPLALDDVSVGAGYRLVGPARAPDEVPARLSDGTPWLVVGRAGAGTYRLVGSPLEPGATDLPVSAFMVPLLEWLVSPAGGDGGVTNRIAGDPISLPTSATDVETPDGVRYPADGTLEFRATRRTGIYRVLAEDSVIAHVAVNAPVAESLLDPAADPAVTRAFGPGSEVVDDLDAWSDAVFVQRRGSELWRWLLLAALALLLFEGWVAASGRATPRAEPRRSTEPSLAAGAS